jgi:hypothetical protein
MKKRNRHANSSARVVAAPVVSTRFNPKVHEYFDASRIFGNWFEMIQQIASDTVADRALIIGFIEISQAQRHRLYKIHERSSVTPIALPHFASGSRYCINELSPDSASSTKAGWLTGQYG